MPDQDQTARSDDFDPASPPSTEAVADARGVAASNFGIDGRGDVPLEEGVELPFGQPASVEVDIAAAQSFLRACMTSVPRVSYGLGAKIKPGQVPGRDFKAVDCSGFVREALRRSTNLGSRFPDGSVVQHDWVKAHGFPPVADPAPDAVSIAFLSPGDTTSGIGHVVLIHAGQTLESHGGVGPDARPWDRRGWQAKAKVFVLDSTA